MSLFDRILAGGLRFVPRPIVRHFSRPYIAGASNQDMIRVVRELNARGFLATVDVLGESTKRREKAEEAVRAYETVMDQLRDEKLRAKVSVKLTQMGLLIDKDFCRSNLERLVSRAEEHDSFVRIDMEDSSCTTDTLGIYHHLRDQFGDRVGVVIQSCLRRTREDVRRLADVRANVRICKGIYIEPRAIAYKDGAIINRNFTFLLEELLRAGCYVGIATHDEKLVWEAFRIIDLLGLPPSRYEFQMLLGVDEALRNLIRDAGHRLRVYVPFGAQWHAYSVRRLRENPRLAGYVVKNLFQGSP